MNWTWPNVIAFDFPVSSSFPTVLPPSSTQPPGRLFERGGANPPPKCTNAGWWKEEEGLLQQRLAPVLPNQIIPNCNIINVNRSRTLAFFFFSACEPQALVNCHSRTPCTQMSPNLIRSAQEKVQLSLITLRARVQMRRAYQLFHLC